MVLPDGGRALADAAAKEKLAGVGAAWASALKCVPFVMPRQWVTYPSQMAEELAMLTIHTDPLIREVCLPRLPCPDPQSFAMHSCSGEYTRKLYPYWYLLCCSLA